MHPPRPCPPQLWPPSCPQLAVEANEAKNKAKAEVFTTVAQIEEATRQQQVRCGCPYRRDAGPALRPRAGAEEPKGDGLGARAWECTLP